MNGYAPCVPYCGMVAGGSKPSPVSNTVSDRKRASSTRFAEPPSTRYRSASATTPAGTEDSAISSASGTDSPPSSTVGMPDVRSAASPSSQARLPPSSRTTAMSAPSVSAARSPGATRVGLPIR